MCRGNNESFYLGIWGTLKKKNHFYTERLKHQSPSFGWFSGCITLDSEGSVTIMLEKKKRKKTTYFDTEERCNTRNDQLKIDKLQVNFIIYVVSSTPCHERDSNSQG